MKILALDLGAKTGWCLLWDGDIVGGGVIEFEGNRHERLQVFNSWLYQIIDWNSTSKTAFIDVIAYERPFARGLDATRSLWGMAGITEAVGSRHAAVLDVHNATIKAWAYPGEPKKVGTMKKARELLGCEPVDDNHADAVCLAHYVAENAKVGTNG